MNLPAELLRTLQGTGFMIGNEPAPGLSLDGLEPKSPSAIRPDAIWRDRSQLEVVFKHSPSEPSGADLASWHRDAWNLGLVPLLWVVSPQDIRIYNAYQRPISYEDADKHLLKRVELVDDKLALLDDYAGRLSMASGRFWLTEDRVQREGRVDIQLLRDLHSLERQLCAKGQQAAKALSTDVAQGLLGRSIFVRYLADRNILPPDKVRELCNCDLRSALGQYELAYRLFEWVRSKFNGDLFPITPEEQETVQDEHLKLVSETLAGVDPDTGQGSLWAYRFDVIPIELISSIYEQFAHAAHGGTVKKAKKEGVHYTPISVVSLVLDQVIGKSDSDARVLDISCGSGVFLVEALRRLVRLKAHPAGPTRSLIRETLKKQIFGVDKSEPAIRVASFSLYLAVIELDPDVTEAEALRFDPIVGRNLFVGNAFDFDRSGEGHRLAGRKFDVIVGNPPWTYGGKGSRINWPAERDAPIMPPRSQDFGFVWRSMDFAHFGTRFGVVMRATPFFSRSASSCRARDALISALGPVAIVNLSALRNELFPTATYPAVILLARVEPLSGEDELPIVTVPWTPRFSRTGAFEISPSDVRTASVSHVASSPELMKAISLGTPRDRLLLRRMKASATTLRLLLGELGTDLITGIHKHLGDRKRAHDLIGLPLLEANSLKPVIDVASLPVFELEQVDRPRTRAAFEGPLVLVGEGIRNARPAVGVSKKDLVYTQSFYGISFSGLAVEGFEIALRLGGVLLSSVSAWNALLTASEFGVNKRKLLRMDVADLPTPTLSVLRSADAARISEAMKKLGKCNGFDKEALTELDDAVFDIYGLETHERLVVQDGLDRAKREYKSFRQEAEAAAMSEQLEPYASTFLSVVNAWQGALGREPFDAQILNLRPEAPLRVIRFMRGGTGVVRLVEAASDLKGVLARIGDRIRLEITENLAAVRELRIHGESELLVIKPSARRYWTPAAGLNDADSSLSDSLNADSQ